MTSITKNIVDIDENLRLLGTAHVSKTSVNLVREQINLYKPDVVAVELCQSRLSALKKPEGIDNEDLLKICLLYTSPSPRDGLLSRMPSSA